MKEDAWIWDKWLKPLLNAVQQVLLASTRFSPISLLCWYKHLGVCSVIWENWEERSLQSKNEIQYTLDPTAKLHKLGQLTQEYIFWCVFAPGWSH